MTENELSAIVIREAIDIHKALGPGLLEFFAAFAVLSDLCDANTDSEGNRNVK